MTKPALLIATPCYGGQVCDGYFHSIMNTLRLLRYEKGFQVHVQTLNNESLITRARNTFVAFFLNNPSYTHLMFIDADVMFRAEDVLRFLEYDKDVVCGSYPTKAIWWDVVAQEAQKDAKNLEQRCYKYTAHVADQSNAVVEDGLVEAFDGPTGFMMVNRRVIEKMIEAYPELQYRVNMVANGVRINPNCFYTFFDCMVEPQTKHYLSEDYAFCRRWQAIGGKIHACLDAPLVHVGTYAFAGHHIQQVSPRGLVHEHSPAQLRETS